MTVERRPQDDPCGSRTVPADFTWGADDRTTMVVLVVVSLFELVLVEWVVPWTWVRVVAAVTGIATLGWVVLLLRATRRRPHVVGPDAVVLRHGLRGELTLPVPALRSVELVRRSADDGRSTVVPGEVVLPVGGQTTVTVHLAEPVTVSVGRRSADVVTARFSADDSPALVAHLRAVLVERG